MSFLIFLLEIREKLGSYKKCQRIDILNKWDQVITKALFALTIPEKIFGTK